MYGQQNIGGKKKVTYTFQGRGGGGKITGNLYIKLHAGLPCWRNICVTFKTHKNNEFFTMQRSNNHPSALPPLSPNRECLNPGLVRQIC